MAGLARARAAGRVGGRPSVPKAKQEAVIEALNSRETSGETVRTIAKRMRLDRCTVQRIATRARPFADAHASV
jgi:DNA invertase Pin-like site-specific DNA recombinase